MEVVEHNIDRKSCPVLFYANNFEWILDFVSNWLNSVDFDFLYDLNSVIIYGLSKHALNLRLHYKTNNLLKKINYIINQL
jgi:hypothetical protein